MGNSIGGKRRRPRVMTVDGATYKYRPPAAAADALRDHPGHHLLESDEVRRLGVRARPLDPDAPLKPGKLYFLVELPKLSVSRRRGAPQRTWSGALTYGGAAAGAGERLESLMVARRSASDVASSPAAAAASVEAAEDSGGGVRLRVRLPKADVQRLVDESRDAAEAAERIMELCVARDQRRGHRSAPGTPLVVPVAAAMPPAITSGLRYNKNSGNNKTAGGGGKKEKRARFVTVPDEIIGF
ncbi:unnamed protein product [Urochloa decumbens]|uniref:Uncharacterized protein n=1 Tax=Urochloa decumbens TaxID=240449 RepID=A0ABC9BK27_9POAL